MGFIIWDLTILIFLKRYLTIINQSYININYEVKNFIPFGNFPIWNE